MVITVAWLYVYHKSHFKGFILWQIRSLTYTHIRTEYCTNLRSTVWCSNVSLFLSVFSPSKVVPSFFPVFLKRSAHYSTWTPGAKQRIPSVFGLDQPASPQLLYLEGLSQKAGTQKDWHAFTIRKAKAYSLLTTKCSDYILCTFPGDKNI